VEQIIALILGGEEALCLAGCLEPFPLSFSPSRWLVRILGSVIQAIVLSVFDGAHHLGFDRAVKRPSLLAIMTRGARHCRFSSLPRSLKLAEAPW
jgi:hypothetical protein